MRPAPGAEADRATSILPGIVEEGERLLGTARRDGVTLCMLGGVAVRLRAQQVPTPLDREYKDLDFAVPKGGGGDAAKLLRESGYEPEVVFNAMNGKERMLFHDPANGRQVDVFVGSFRMCHEIPFANRLSSTQPTVPLAELVLTKLQIVQLNEKDVRDTVLIFHGHDIGDHDEEVVNGDRIAELCASDWGLWRTITANLARCVEHLDDYALPESDRRRVSSRVNAVLERIEQAPKTRGWKLRARIGERKRWYELPEEVEQ
jgi:hypothetical protein